VDFVVFSHLRWDFVYQRPQHLVTRATRDHRVLFVEEAIEGPAFDIACHETRAGVTVVKPTVPPSTSRMAAEAFTAGAVRHLVSGWQQDRLVVWHYSVMAEPLSRDLPADVAVFDCMDELSAFIDAPPELPARERALIDRADLVFTGGYSLWEAKRALHPRVHAFPSSVDVAHFGRARVAQPEPAALAGIARPRFVFAGVIDERMDLGLVSALASAAIGEVVLIGPAAKIDPGEIPTGPRIHRLGSQPYDQLPAYFAHADVGIMPFALNEATRYISPTKTPEYLAAGLPVVSTPVADVVRGYGDLDMVTIADGAGAFAAACSASLTRPRNLDQVDERLATMSWDATWWAMERLIEEVIAGRRAA
jgi:glycosyltransferase involved in cell wall biosynthesis